MAKKFLKRLYCEEKGLAVVIVAAALTVILGFLALVVDVGTMYLTKNRLSNACDAAALAGARDLINGKTKAENEAIDYLLKNIEDSFTSQISVSDDERKITVTAKQEVEYTFAQVLGLTSGNVEAEASAIRYLPRVTEYALFSGHDDEPLKITANNSSINGPTHTNNTLDVTGENNEFNGIVEYHEKDGTPDKNEGDGNIYEDEVIATEYIPIPDYSTEMKKLVNEGDTYSDSIEIESDFNIDGGIYVKGDVDIRTDDLDSSEGFILAEGDITIYGDDMSASSLYGDDNLCFYSINGNINLKGDNLEYHGIFYAPNGQISLQGDDIDITGSAISNTVSYTEGTDITREQAIIDKIFWEYGLCKLVS